MTAALGTAVLAAPAPLTAFTVPVPLPRAGCSATAAGRSCGSGLAGYVAARSTGAWAVAAAAYSVLLGSRALGGLRRRCRHSLTARRVSRVQWNSRVKRIEDFRAIFDVTIPKPLGIVPRNFGNRPGVGIASIKPGSNAEKLNYRVILKNQPGMWVLEGDEVIAVNGVDCEGQGLNIVGPLVKNAEGDEVTLKLCRNYQKGPVKVVWLPGQQMITMVRGALLRTCAEAARADVKYNCKDGWCSSCWHTEDTSNLVHRICKFEIPEDWDNVIPLMFLRADETFSQKGLQVEHLLQADGFMPPPPPGIDGSSVRKAMQKENIQG